MTELARMEMRAVYDYSGMKFIIRIEVIIHGCA
jgi:hypothetical protein